MQEDDETATARYIAGNISTQLMLKTIVEIISTMADDPTNIARVSEEVARDGRHRVVGSDVSNARKERPCIRA